MDYSKLSNYQLFELIQNHKLNPSLRTAANREFEKRNISLAEKKEIISKHEALFTPEKKKTLSDTFKTLLVIFPFPFTIYIAYLHYTKGIVHKQEQKECWKFYTIGFVLWSILLCAYFLFNR